MATSVLLVDDDEDLLFLVGKQLEMSGFKVTTCQHGKNFSKQLLHDMPQVVLLDIAMGAVSGTELCDIVRGNRKTKDIKVLIMSGNNDISEIADACGADGFIRKPLDMGEIKDKIHALV